MTSSTPPAWLPAKVVLTGNTVQDVATLSAIFDRDFVRGLPSYLGIPVGWTKKLVTGERYCEAFWHIVSRKDQATGVRQFDPDRAEKLSWCAAILTNVPDPSVKHWDVLKGKGVVRTYVWLEQFDYVVILEKGTSRGARVAFLVTAYHVDGSRTRKQLTDLHRRRIR